MNSLMHPGARDTMPDTSAFIYSAMRLPDCILDTRLIILGQNASVSGRAGFPTLKNGFLFRQGRVAGDAFQRLSTR